MIKKIFIFLLLLGTPLFFAIEVKAGPSSFHANYATWIMYTSNWAIPDGTEYMEIYIPPLSYIVPEKDGYSTVIQFLNAGGWAIEYITWEDRDLLPGMNQFIEADGRLILDLLALSSADYLDIMDAVTFRLELVLNSNFPYEYIRDHLEPWLQSNFIYAFDAEIEIPNQGSIPIIYYDRLSQYFYHEYGGTPSIPFEPPNPFRFGHNFLGWFEHPDKGGEQYFFDESLDQYLPGVQSQLYARWRANTVLDYDEPDVDILDTIMNAMGLAGLNTVGGRTLIYFIIVLFLTVSLLLLQLSPVIILSVNFILTIIFMFMGWFPIYMIIILGGSLIFGFIAALKGGM